MQTIEYDLNVSGGLMPQINALTAPPTSDESNKRRKLKKSISRQNPLTNDSNNNTNHQNNRQILSRQTKTGKAPNHEYCDSCREGGDLLCCDRCPNAFHLQCHDPPLDEEDVPQGEWLCRKCKIIIKEDIEWEDEDSDEYEDIESDPKAIQKPFSLLIRAAQTLNPKQFQLPNDLMPSIPLVGTSKRVNNNKNALKKQIHELDNNSLVSFPVKLCYQCSKSCRKAPLIQCDYCPLLFHADCLDPPLTCLPTGRWMCPNHSQHVVEQKLLDSVSLSQRIKLWNQFAGHISQDTIKLDFLKKVHRKNPPFRAKVEIPQTPKVVVPDAIKQMYKTRPSLLPNLNQLSYHLNSSSSDYSVLNKLENECKYEKPSLEQQEEWLSNLIAFQSSVAQRMSSSKTSDLKNKQSLENSFATIASGKESDSTKVNDISVKFNSQTMNGPTDHSSEDSSKKDTNSDNKESLPQITDIIKPLNGEKGSPSPISSPFSDKRISIQNNMSNIETIADTYRLDESLIRVLALQRVQQLNTRENNNNSSIVSQPITTMQSFPTTIRRIGLNDVRARAVLCPIVIKSSTGTTSGPYILMSYRTLTIGTSSDSDVVLGHYGHCNYVSAKHATIFYDESSRNYELINYSEHGTTVDNVLYSCDFSDKKTNPKHSNVNSHTVSAIKSIANKRKRKSFEENKKLKNSMTSQELVSEKSKSIKRRKIVKNEETETNAQKISELKTSKIIFRWDNESEDLEKVSTPPRNPLTMSSKSGQTHKPCACKSSCSSLIGSNGAGWEGTAVLHHGSHLKIGCHQFIFSITSHGITQNQSNHSSNSSKSPIKVEASNSK